MKVLRITLLIALTTGAMLLVNYLYKTGPQAKEKVWIDAPLVVPEIPLRVHAADFPQPVAEAIDMWNEEIGCDLFELSSLRYSTVTVKSADGIECNNLGWIPSGPTLKPFDTESHSAGAVQCSPSTYEVIVHKPGDLRTQYCIVAHELGHILGLDDDGVGYGVMNQFYCPEVNERPVLPSDKDKAALQERFCKRKTEGEEDEQRTTK